MEKILHISIIFFIFAKGIVGGHVPMTRGYLIHPFPFIKDKIIKEIRYMSKKRTLQQLLVELKSIHGDRYGYDLVNDDNYKSRQSKIPVYCYKHDYVFNIIVGNHLYGQGCPICGNEKRRLSNTGNVRKRPKYVWGVGVNDYKGNIKYNNVHLPSYHTWVEMLKRCFCDNFKNKNKTYTECKCCDEWKKFSDFKKWFDDPVNGYHDGYCLDKDILIKGNKIYSPDTCCFVPNEINVLLCKSDKKRGKMPIGVYERKMVDGYKYVAYVNNNIKKHFHLGTFDTPEEAFRAYKQAKELHIQEMATQYFNEGKITKKVYDALLNYKVEITD